MIKINVITVAKNSATTIDSQIPSTPIMRGKIKTAATWKTNVRHTESNADINPLFSDVNTAEPNIENPAIK